MNSLTAVSIGKWYRRPNGQPFEVVAIDERSESIEVQYFDGALEDIEMENMRDEVLESVAPPEDWSASMDVSTKDCGYDGDIPSRQDWDSRSPLDRLNMGLELN